MLRLRTFGSIWSDGPVARLACDVVVSLGRPKVEPGAKTLIEDPDNRKLVSIATCWEIAIKAGLGKLTLGEPSQSFLSREIPRNNFELLSISLDHATSVEELPQHHKDPFDRLIIAQAIAEDIPIVSSDSAFDAHPIRRLW